MNLTKNIKRNLRKFQQAANDWGKKKVALWQSFTAIIVALISSPLLALMAETPSDQFETTPSPRKVSDSGDFPDPDTISEDDQVAMIADAQMAALRDGRWCPELLGSNGDIDCAVAAYVESMGECRVPTEFMSEGHFALSLDAALALYCLDLERNGLIKPLVGP